MQISLVSTPPISDTKMIVVDGKFVLVVNCITRMMPYPPSFSRIAARIIDPAIGASTCALGNHKCDM